MSAETVERAGEHREPQPASECWPVRLGGRWLWAVQGLCGAVHLLPPNGSAELPCGCRQVDTAPMPGWRSRQKMRRQG